MKLHKGALNKIPFIWRKSGKEWEKVNTMQVSKDAGSKFGVDQENAMKLLSIIVVGESLDLPPDLSVKESSALTKTHAALTQTWNLHLKQAEDVKAEAEAEKERKKNEKSETTSRIMVASAKGFSLAQVQNDVAVKSVVSTMQKIVGNKYEVTSVGLTPKAGAKFTDEDASVLISGLANASEGSGRINAAVNWSFGDACLFVRKNFPNGEDIINQAISLNGQAKHTAIQSMRVCEFFKPEDRIAEWSFSHHQDFMNYGAKLSAKERAEVIAEATAEKTIEAEIVTPTGEKIVQKKPISVRKLREILQEKGKGKTGPGVKQKKEAPKKETPAAAPEAPAAPTVKGSQYLYVDSNGVVSKSVELAELAVQDQSFIVIDLAGMCTLDSKGAEYEAIGNLGEEWFAPAEKKVEKTPDKKSSKKKSTPAPEPEDDDDGIPT